MNFLKSKFLKLYRFLGGIHFALFLIGSTAFAVIVGTFIESLTQSHQYAAQFTYSHPIFSLLIWGFFINILISALRRYPFKIKHIPFLITHLGLLMILSGVLIKIYFGIQGSMSIAEGTSSRKIFETSSYALHVQDRAGLITEHEIKTDSWGNFKRQILKRFDGLQLNIGKHFPHSSERYSTWVKGDFISITGLSPIPLVDFDAAKLDSENPFQISPQSKVRFNKEDSPWNIYAVKTHFPDEFIQKLYAQIATIKTTDRFETRDVSIESLNSLNHKTEIHLSFSEISGFNNPHLVIESLRPTLDGNKCQIALSGGNALLNQNLTTPYLGNIPKAYDIICPSSLCFIEDQYNDIHIITINSLGQIDWQQETCSKLETLIAYDDGFFGYAVQKTLPLTESPFTRSQREQALETYLANQLQEAATLDQTFSPPLKLWFKMCKKQEAPFGTSFVEFLKWIDSTNTWIFPKQFQMPSLTSSHLENLDWKSISLKDVHACNWCATLFEGLDPLLSKGDDIVQVLKDKHWPLIDALIQETKQNDDQEKIDPHAILTLLTQQIFSASSSVPSLHDEPIFVNDNAIKSAELFSSYLRAYGISLSTIIPSDLTTQEMDQLLKSDVSLNEDQIKPVTIETSVNTTFLTLPPITKLEELFPLIEVKAKINEAAKSCYLSYDRYGTGLKWPILNGEYLVRFQPVYKEIPFKIRLRNARQINYPTSEQAYSYESDLLITDLRDGHVVEKTISMNNVHETWDGYRFYLASMNPSNEGSLKRIQLVVNHDPAKYWLTYPGAFILSLGILLLFTLRPYKKNREK